MRSLLNVALVAVFLCGAKPNLARANCYVLENNTNATQIWNLLYNSPIGEGLPVRIVMIPHGRYPASGQWCWPNTGNFQATVTLGFGAYRVSWPGSFIMGDGPRVSPSGTYALNPPIENAQLWKRRTEWKTNDDAINWWSGEKEWNRAGVDLPVYQFNRGFRITCKFTPGVGKGKWQHVQLYHHDPLLDFFHKVIHAYWMASDDDRCDNLPNKRSQFANGPGEYVIVAWHHETAGGIRSEKSVSSTCSPEEGEVLAAYSDDGNGTVTICVRPQ
jgi:hypothetical protein